MLEIILLIFLTRSIGKLAEKKGLRPTLWKWGTVLAWIVCEIIGANLFMSISHISPEELLMSPDMMLRFMFFSIFSAFGGFLIIRAMLTNKPDANQPL